MEKLTTRDFSVGIKIMAVAIPLLVSSGVALVTISMSTGQTVQRIDTIDKKLEKLETKVDDTVKVKEQTAVDIAVMKSEMKNMNNRMGELIEILTPKRKTRDE